MYLQDKKNPIPVISTDLVGPALKYSKTRGNFQAPLLPNISQERGKKKNIL